MFKIIFLTAFLGFAVNASAEIPTSTQPPQPVPNVTTENSNEQAVPNVTPETSEDMRSQQPPTPVPPRTQPQRQQDTSLQSGTTQSASGGVSASTTTVMKSTTTIDIWKWWFPPRKVKFSGFIYKCLECGYEQAKPGECPEDGTELQKHLRLRD